jgi:hypothetical protein
MHQIVTRELFSPVSDGEARRAAGRKKLQDLPVIRGSGYVLPVADEAFRNSELARAYTEGLNDMLGPVRTEGPLAQQYLDTVTGFDLLLPEEFDREDFRVTLVYFHGDVARGDVHIRAFIEEVIPTTLRLLRRIAERTAALVPAPVGLFDQEQASQLRSRYRSVPYLLARAYGGSYLWDCLHAALRRRPLELARPTRNAAQRMNSLAHNLPDNIWDLKEEVSFFLAFVRFSDEYNRTLVRQEDGRQPPCTMQDQERRPTMGMRPWKELLTVLEQGSAEEATFATPAELGFACGALIRQFSRWYYNATRKDFLKHRVMTFGSDLSPEVVWKRALSKVFDVAARYSTIHIPADYRQRVGAVLVQLVQMEDQVRRQRDEFMTGFWAGYTLQGSGREEG